MALDLPNIRELGPPTLSIIRLERYCPSATKITMGKTQLSSALSSGSVCWMISPENLAPESLRVCIRSGSGIMPVL